MIIWISAWGVDLGAPVHVPVDVWRKHWPVMLGAIVLMIVVVLIRGNGKGSPMMGRALMEEP